MRPQAPPVVALFRLPVVPFKEGEVRLPLLPDPDSPLYAHTIVLLAGTSEGMSSLEAYLRPGAG